MHRYIRAFRNFWAVLLIMISATTKIYGRHSQDYDGIQTLKNENPEEIEI